ncbi:ferritin-like domain-containing protein [Nakamurella flavida]|uniref:Ferritin-like domain-containing protein n=1 Tax=Nakamurella flavida TaxID=363630 RepID=A0A938YI46_9ACTN|nr:ferritin-like domain-containing protein [Nakamurella flavida]MBM9475031.1 ferritin-like domain-containing protein [Nakamurella flavida]MDP9776600.1 hypothetical protein [Nakamurella flavida]
MTAPSTPAGDPGTSTAPPENVDSPTGAVGTPTPTVAAGPLGQDEIDALQGALGAEQAAVYSYGLVAAHPQDQNELTTTLQILQGHRNRRDLTEERLTQGGATPVGNAAAYQPATPVTDVAGARVLAQDIEFDCAAAWRVVIGSTDQAELRGFALAGLSDAAVRLAQWKVLAGTVPSTVPFPGQG